MTGRCIRSVLARGNGAVVVHRLLEQGIAGYRLAEIDPRIAAVPPAYRLVARPLLADAGIAHVAADYGESPVGADCVRLVAFHNFYIDDENLAASSPAQRFYYRHVMRRSVMSALRTADHVVVVSKFLAGCVSRLSPRVPVEVIHNGIDTGRFAPEAHPVERPLRVLFVGNPSRRKGFPVLQQVAARLPDGVELAFTAGLRNEAPVRAAGGLLPLGRVPYDRMHELYRQADILFFPTQREGFGLCVAEAMSCGLPVVSTNCSAIPELIDEGKGGFLLPPGDIDGMVRALLRLLASPSLRADMGAHNRSRALRDFTLPRMLRDYESLFNGVRRR